MQQKPMLGKSGGRAGFALFFRSGEKQRKRG